MNSLASMRSNKAPLIYNIDRNTKSSRVPEPELIKGATGEREAKTVVLTNWKIRGNKVIRILIA